MTNRERYRNAAEHIRPSAEMNVLNYVEGHEMKRSRRPLRTVAVVFAAAALVLMMTVGAYAADIGGVQHKVSTWLHGEATEVTVTYNEDEQSYTLTYPDGTERTTGGLVYEGSEPRPMTEEEILDTLNEPDMDWDDEGNVFVYIRDHKIDVTDQIRENGYAQVEVKDGLLTDYVTVVMHGENQGFGISSGHFGYPSVEELKQSTGTL